ncbi:hypothetical protein PAXINDRAFT_9449 [Paxillus involutus ATCC 200175]|nr:hypothetical protein PAXINDRAFT_9449 [Paxillus involutus ATCC 200175]
MYQFATLASYDTFAYSSRIARTTAYSTVLRTLRGLSEQEAEAVKELGCDVTKYGVLVTDNVQNYLLQQDARIGCINTMNTGLAATYIEVEDVDPKAFDLEDKRQRLANSRRSGLTVHELHRLIDHQHICDVMGLQSLLTLATYVPELSHVKEHVSKLYRTRHAKLRLSERPSKVHPLATNGKNETVTTELKDGLLDFLAQIGQDAGVDHHLQRLIIIVGDGLTFEKILQLKKYLQFHPDAFQSFELIEPRLAVWHTLWTDLSRIFETHWGHALSRDPSTIGHSATKISRKQPASLKKVDYYPYSELLYTILDARILDCWRIILGVKDLFGYFKDLAAQKKLPSERDLDWMKNIPEGSQWVEKEMSSSRAEDTSDVAHSAERRADGAVASSTKHRKMTLRKKASTADAGEEKTRFHGDLILVKSIAFMRDALLSREAAYAVADGDAGRVYETMKVMLFTFAGSNHSKYMSYLLETIVTLELESSPELRNASLRSTLANLTGRAGSFSALDFIQEYFNRMLQAIVQKKGVNYGDPYIRETISRNLHHFGRIKKEFREDMLLAARSGRHSAPHTKPEIRILMDEYAKAELHS